MKPDRWEKIQQLFDAASQLPEEERRAFLAAEGADESTVDEVFRLLSSDPPSQFLVPPPVQEASEGRELGDFTLLEEVGRGGMGVVYKARQESLGRSVAVKVLPANLTMTQRQVERFQREARAAARLHHPGVVSILIVGEEKGTHYFAMEFVDGRNLAEELLWLRSDLGGDRDERAQLPSTQEVDYFRTVAEIVRQAADALAYAHQQGIVHRDIKPSNLLLDSKRRVKIVDFGLARDEEQGSLSTTRAGAGTPYYMSPEQAHAQNRRVDHRTDIYSLGVVLFELLTLSRPFEGSTSREVLDGILRNDPPRIRKLNRRVPRDLETICMKAMARSPKDRFGNAEELRDELARFLAHEAILTQPPSIAELVVRGLHRQRRTLGTLAVVLAASLLAVQFALDEHDRTRRRRLEDEIRAALASEDLGSLPVSRVFELRTRAEECRRLRPEADVLAAVSDDPILLLEQALEDWRLRMAEDGRRDLELAKDQGRSEGAREFHLLRGMRTLLQASHLFPDDEELSRDSALESVFPTVSVDAADEAGAAVPAHVLLRRIDVLTSGVEKAVTLGPTPLHDIPIQPGYYRVVVVFESGGFRELVCNPGPAFTHIELTARRSANEAAVAEEMVRFDPASYVFPDDGQGWQLEGRDVSLDGFYLDATEVSNADYQRFASATGRAAPGYWKLVPDLDQFLARFGDHPVVGIGWYDAVAYAEWCGKRLPTAAEWVRAACGLENRSLPYGPTSDEPVRGNVHAPYDFAGTPEEQWAQYIAYSSPVRSHADASTPEGLLHMFGNVLEFTESMMVDVLERGYSVPRAYDRISFGSNWSALALNQPMRAPEYFGVGDMYNSHRLGFRCAKSVEP